MRATRSTAPVLRCKSKVKITLSRERVLASITAPRAFFFWQAEVLYTHTPSYARTHVTYIRNRDTHAVPSPCIIIQPRDCERDSHEWLCKAWARPPHRIFKSLKFLLVVNIVMLSAAVVTPSLSASGLFFSFPSSSLFLNFCLSLSLSLSLSLFRSLARSLALSPFSSCLPFFLAFFPFVQNLRSSHCHSRAWLARENRREARSARVDDFALLRQVIPLAIYVQ